MNLIANLLIALAIAVWIGAMSVFSIQNIQLVSLRFLLFETVELPIGVLLAFSVGVGLIIGAITPLFWSRKKPQRRQTKDFDLS